MAPERRGRRIGSARASVEVPAGPGRGPRRGWRPAARWGPQAPSGIAAGPPPPSLTIPHRCPGPLLPSGAARGEDRRHGRAAAMSIQRHAPSPAGTASSIAADQASWSLPARSMQPTALGGLRQPARTDSTASQPGDPPPPGHDDGDQGPARPAPTARRSRVATSTTGQRPRRRSPVEPS